MNAVTTITNAVRRLETMFPGYFQTSGKRDHYPDFGFPKTITFEQFWQMYARNGIARAAVSKTILKTWETSPYVQENDDASDLTQLETDLQQRFADLRFWQKIAEADRRSLVGNYAGLVLRFADGKRFNEPVDRVPGGLDGLVEVIPAWQAQLTVDEWHNDELQENYGSPKMFTFNEAALNGTTTPRKFAVHPDRVVVWSQDGTVHNDSSLSAGYNDLITIEKVIGAGGEGFWKNAKSAPVLQIDKDAKAEAMAQAMGVSKTELADAMNTQVNDWQKGFDSLLMLQGMEAKTLGVTLPQPAEFVNVALQSFASSWGIPIKILVGMQTGERASQEDAKEWAKTCMARRNGSIVPNIMQLIRRLERFGVMAEKPWSVDWADLTESDMAEKIDRATKMADINVKNAQSGGIELTFTEDEIRETIGKDPLL